MRALAAAGGFDGDAGACRSSLRRGCGLPASRASRSCYGTEGSVRAATLKEVDFVVSAIVGVAGLEATYAAVMAGKPIGLANKECMVAAGEILTRRGAREEGAAAADRLRAQRGPPVHAGGDAAGGEADLADGFGRPVPQDCRCSEFEHITAEQALKHPTWVMGQRITIDSATMLNKGLEIIEACRLFDLPPAQVQVTVHPQSTVHSLVEYMDGSILAQISVTDMRLPILYALSYPERVESELTFDMRALADLDFEPPDLERFPCLRLAYEAAEAGGAHPIALNAADEVAVAAFLEGRISFMGIPRTIEEVLAATPASHPATIAEVLEVDAQSRERARCRDCGKGCCSKEGYASPRLTEHTPVRRSNGCAAAARREAAFLNYAFRCYQYLSTLIVLGIMVLVHEFGHFAVAKLFRVKVEVFSIGFGKRLFGFRRGDTDYRLSLLPLGGYVKMQGELGGDGTVPLETTVLSGTAARAMRHATPAT